MSFLHSHKKVLSMILVFCFTILTLGFSPAQARMVPTVQSSVSQSIPDRVKLNAFLEREDVKKQLEAWGLDEEMAKVRINDLTDQEVSLMAEKLDQLPAGGDGLGILVGAAVFVFLVLLVTDILGFTDVFPFTK